MTSQVWFYILLVKDAFQIVRLQVIVVVPSDGVSYICFFKCIRIFRSRILEFLKRRVCLDKKVFPLRIHKCMLITDDVCHFVG